MVNEIKQTSRSDAQLEALFRKAQEYAEIYLMARQRLKGCDGMGELATMKDEFKSVIDDMIEYCKGKKYLPDDIVWDIDLIANELAGR